MDDNAQYRAQAGERRLSASDHPCCPPLEALVSILPDQIRAEQRQLEAQVALGRGDFDDARSAYAPLIASGNPSPTVLKDRGGALLKQGLFDDAIADCEMGIKRDPHNPVCHLRLIYALLSLQRNADVSHAYERALLYCPNDAGVREMAVVIGPTVPG
jgi:tetratricopeptide (TPR) repeat protein